MKMIGVTGTNGKTTTVELLRQLLSDGTSVTSLGTLGLISGDFTDFEPRIFNATGFNNYLDEITEQLNPDHFIFEAYSTALSLNIYPDSCIDIAILTNIKEDHLDFHGNKDNYIRSKLKLFNQVLNESGTAVFREQDEHADSIRSICKKRNLRTVTFGYSSQADLQIINLENQDGHALVSVRHSFSEYQYKLPFTGELFVFNWLCALCAYYILTGNLSFKNSQLNQLHLPSGRKELITTYNNAHVYVDYAHNADGFRTVLQAFRSETTNRLHVLFGCGGNRDASKRKEMGQIAEELADVVYVTSDNPRDEDPLEIIKDILSACPNAISHPDRQAAITLALGNILPHDTLVIAGKGHEIHQEIGNKKFSHSDKEFIQAFLDIK